MKKPNAGLQRFRFNFIDLILICVMLAAAAMLIYIFKTSDISIIKGSERTEIEYTVEIRQVREEFRNFIQNYDKVTDTVTQYALGEVVNVEYAPARYTGVNRTTGTLVFSDYPEHMNVTVTIRAEATAGDGEYSIDGYKIAVGKAVALRVPGFTGEGYCTKLREVPSDG